MIRIRGEKDADPLVTDQVATDRVILLAIQAVIDLEDVNHLQLHHQLFHPVLLAKKKQT